MTTLEQLQRRYTRPYVTLDELRQDHLPHIKTDQHLKRLLTSGELTLHTQRLHNSNRAPQVVYLAELARWLDERAAAA